MCLYFSSIPSFYIIIFKIYFLRTDKEVSVNRIPYHMPCTFAYLFC